jgi:hypothetical protein
VRVLNIKTANTTTASNATATWATDENDPAVWAERIDEAAFGGPHVNPAVVKQVDELILATMELIQESLDRAEQAAWERGMGTNVVVDPCPSW